MKTRNLHKIIFALSLPLVALTGAHAQEEPAPEETPAPQTVPPIYPYPGTPSNITVKSGNLGNVIEVENVATYNSYSIQRKTSTTNWVSFSYNRQITQRGSGTYWLKIADPLDENVNGVQYRLRACNVSGCSGWSAATTATNFVYYSRNTADSNANGIRDDVELHANFLHADGSNEHAYLLHYAYFMQRLLSNTYGPSNDMYIDFSNMSEALTCSSDRNAMAEIKAMLLDSETAYNRYLSAMDDYSNAVQGAWKTSPECGVTTQYNSPESLPSYLISEKEQEAKISEAQQEYKKQTSLLKPKNDSVTSSIQQPLATTNYKYVVYVNGVLNDWDDAETNRKYIKKLFEEFGAPSVNVSLSHNFSEGVRLDMVQSFKQYISSPNSSRGWFQLISDLAKYSYGVATSNIPQVVITNYLAKLDYTSYRNSSDFNTLRDNVSTRIRLGDVVLLSHSQGNFFANEMWEEIYALNGSNTKNFLRVYGLGSPASYVPNNGYYYTNTNDIVVDTIKVLGITQPLPANINITSSDITGHGLIPTYLKYGAEHTSTSIARILQYFDEMGSPLDNPEMTCESFASSSSAGVNFNGIYTPSPTNNFKGSLRFSADARYIPNRFLVVDKNGSIIFTSNGYMTGSLDLSVYYDAQVNGSLSVKVDGDSSQSDFWEFRILCP